MCKITNKQIVKFKEKKEKQMEASNKSIQRRKIYLQYFQKN